MIKGFTTYGLSSASLGGLARAVSAERDLKGRFLKNNYCVECHKRIPVTHIRCLDCLVKLADRYTDYE